MKRKNLNYIMCFFILINGLICVIYEEKLLPIVPVVCGVCLLIEGIIKGIEGFRGKDYLSLERMDLETGLILIVVGIGILIRGNDSLFIVGIFWGLFGLKKSAKYLNEASYNFFNKEKWKLKSIKGIIEFVLSIILIFDTFGSIGHHIMFLGVELIVIAIIEIINQTKKKLDASVVL